MLKALVKTDPGLTELVAQADTRLKSKVWDDSKITAHHSIIPTAAAGRLEAFSEHERSLYDLIRRGYLAQFFPAHEYDQTTVELDCRGYRFRATGRVSRVLGWKAAYQEPEAETPDGKAGNEAEVQAFPSLNKGEQVLVQDLASNKRQTKPPPPYTEGTLI